MFMCATLTFRSLLDGLKEHSLLKVNEVKVIFFMARMCPKTILGGLKYFRHIRRPLILTAKPQAIANFHILLNTEIPVKPTPPSIFVHPRMIPRIKYHDHVPSQLA